MAKKWEKILEEAKACLRNGDSDNAIHLCDEIIDSPENEIPKEIRAMAFGIRGSAYKEKGDFDRAISDYDEAIKLGFKLDSKNAIAFNNRGNAYQEKGDFDRAISDFDEAIKLDPKFAFAFNNRGNAYQRKGDFDRAISDHDAAIKLDSENAAAFNNRGNAYQRKGDFDRAISDYDEAIKLDPKYAAAFNNRGSAYRKKGDFDRAISDFDEAIELNPKDTKAFHNRALAYGRRDAQASREKYERELEKLREQSEQETKKLRAEFQQASEQSEQDAEKLQEQLGQISEPVKIIAKYENRDAEYKKRIEELASEIKTFVEDLQNRLAAGFVGIALFVALILMIDDASLGFTHGFALTSLMLAWLAANYPASMRLNDMRKEKRKMEICVEDYFRKLTLVLYALAAKGDERQKMMAITHAHFATRSTAEFLADWNPPSDDKPHPILDIIEKIFPRKKDDSPQKSPETKPPA